MQLRQLGVGHVDREPLHRSPGHPSPSTSFRPRAGDRGRTRRRVSAHRCVNISVDWLWRTYPASSAQRQTSRPRVSRRSTAVSCAVPQHHPPILEPGGTTAARGVLAPDVRVLPRRSASSSLPSQTEENTRAAAADRPALSTSPIGHTGSGSGPSVGGLNERSAAPTSLPPRTRSGRPALFSLLQAPGGTARSAAVATAPNIEGPVRPRPADRGGAAVGPDEVIARAAEGPQPAAPCARAVTFGAGVVSTSVDRRVRITLGLP